MGVTDGEDYSVTVTAQPTAPGQVCTVGSGSGTLAGTNVTSVTVSCVNTYTIGGTVAGLAGSGLILQNNSGDDLPIAADGSFTFNTALVDGSAYAVTILAQPTNLSQTCQVSNEMGMLAGANITTVSVDCTTDTFTVSGTVSGLAGSGLVLQNNNGDDLSISSDGSFTFATAVTDGLMYSVSVLTQPANLSQTCVVASGNGTMAGADVSNVSVSCTTDSFTIGGTVSGLLGSGLVLQNNAGDDLAIAANGGFTFVTPVVDGLSYAVTALAQPTVPSQSCVISSGSGTLAGANVTSVVVDCTNDTADLRVEKSSVELTYVPGDPITYMITITNDGPFDVVDALVEDVLPIGMGLDSADWDCIPDTNSICGTDSGVGDVSVLVSIPLDGVVGILVMATTTAGYEDVISNTATVTAPGDITDPDPINNSATHVLSKEGLFSDGFEDPLLALEQWLELILDN
jgi:uncharacterized repeat protein (TIGR01451 family)